MADASTVNPALDRYNRYYNQVLASLQQSAGPYQTDSQLKNYLTRMMRPSYDQAILQRQMQTGQANAAIDADAASRGMGTSTWVTDAKNRQQTSQAADIAAMNGNYNSALYEALLGQIQQREQNRMNLMGQAQGIVGNMYGEFKKYDPLNSHGGSGGGGGIGGGGSGGGGGGGGEDDVGNEYNAGKSNPLFAAVQGALKGAAEKAKAAADQRNSSRQAQLAAQKKKQEADKRKAANAGRSKLSGSSIAVKPSSIYGASIKYDKNRKY